MQGNFFTRMFFYFANHPAHLPHSKTYFDKITIKQGYSGNNKSNKLQQRVSNWEVLKAGFEPLRYYRLFTK